MADVKPVISYSPDDDKWAIRQKVWDYIEAKDLVNFPRPVHNRIPNVLDANLAADQAKGLEDFQKARTVKINPDKPQEQARFNVLEAHKTLLVPTPRLKDGLFNKINPPADCTKEILRVCSTSQGVKEYSSPIDLDSKVKIDLIILGSVAVSPKGYRIGKGEGFADLEYAMMRSMGAVDENTPVVTTVADYQVVDDLPEDIFGPHDVNIDWIVTPTRVIKCEKRTQPSGIIWSILTRNKIKQAPILKKLREREREAGIDVRTKSDLERAEATTEGSEDEQAQGDRPRKRRQRMDEQPNRKSKYNFGENTLFVGRFPRFLRAGDFKAKVKESCEPVQVIWRGRNGHAFLVFDSQEKCDEALPLLSGMAFNGKEVKVEVATPQTRNGPQESGESGGEDKPARRPFQFRKREGGNSTNRRRQEASDHEYDTAEDNDDGKENRVPRRQRNRGRVDPSHCVFVGSMPRTVRASEFKADIRKLGVNPIRVVWRGRNRYALLQFTAVEESQEAMKMLDGFEMAGKPLSVQESTGVSTRQPRDSQGESGEEGSPRPADRPTRGRMSSRGRGRGGARGGARRAEPRRRMRSDSEQDEGQGDVVRKPRRPRRQGPPLTAVFVGNLPRQLRISEFKSRVRDHDVNPLRVQWRGNQGHAFLQFDGDDKADECVKLLQGLTIEERPLTIELSSRGKREKLNGEVENYAENHAEQSE